MKNSFEETKIINEEKEGMDSSEETCDEREEDSRREMTGPSLFNNTNDISKMLNPDMIKKIQKNPKFMEMIKKQEEENKIQNMNPRDKLRARLQQKRNNRMSVRIKESQSEDNTIKQKKTRKPKKPPIATS